MELRRAHRLALIPAPGRQPAGDERGFTLVEVTIAALMLVVGAAGIITSIVLTQLTVRANRESAIVNSVITSRVETITDQCRGDYDATLANYVGGRVIPNADVRGLGTNVQVTALVILDEPGQSPAMDLNGDGDVLDSGIPPAMATAALLEVNVAWRGVLGYRRVAYRTILARGELQ